LSRLDPGREDPLPYHEGGGPVPARELVRSAERQVAAAGEEVRDDEALGLDGSLASLVRAAAPASGMASEELAPNCLNRS
jgi:hypothetical protein